MPPPRHAILRPRVVTQPGDPYDPPVIARAAIVFPVILLSAACGGSRGAQSAALADATAADLAPPQEDTGPPASVLVAEGLVRLDAYRAAAGLEPLEVDEALSAGCAAHVGYMAAHGQPFRNERPSSPHYTAAGAQAGPNAHVAGSVPDLVTAVDQWIAAPYHRLTLLDPGVRVVGAAFGDGYACLDVLSRFERAADFPPVLYPANEQTAVPVAFNGEGQLDPLPAGWVPPVGPIISVLFPAGAVVGPGMTVTVRAADGAALESTVRLPGAPDDPYTKQQRNAVLIFLRLPLQANTRHTVSLDGAVDGGLYTRSWAFTTGDAPGPSPD